MHVRFGVVTRGRVRRALMLACSLSAVWWMPRGVQAQPLSDSDFLWIEPAVTLVSVDSVVKPFYVSIMIDNSTVLGAAAIPLTYAGAANLRADSSFTSPPDIRAVTYGPAGRNAAWTIKTSYITAASKNILLGFISFSSFPRVSDTLAYVHFLAPPSPGGNVILDSTIANNQHLAITDVVAVEFIPVWTPGLITVLAGGLPGDMNCNFETTIGDIVYLVNFLFKGGPEPCSLTMADANCDDLINLGDAIWLVNYLFRGGPPPQPPCGWGQAPVVDRGHTAR